MENEEIFQGTYILDGTPMTEQQQRDKVINLMEIAGIKLTDEEKDQLIIEYEGVTDDNGISETQETQFRVYKPLEKTEEKNEEIENLKSQLEDLRRLRDKLADTTKKDEQLMDSPKITDSKEKLEKKVESLDKRIGALEQETKKIAKDYEESYKKLQQIIDEQNSKLSNERLLSEDEINNIMNEYASLKLDENRKSVEIKEQLDKRKKQIAAMKRKKNQIQDNINKSEALGLTVEDYQDIASTLRKTNIINAILKEKGLEDVINKKAADRTKEEKEMLRAAKEEILKEVVDYKKENKENNAVEAIQKLYMINTTYNRKGNAQVVKMSPIEFNSLKNNTSNLPAKITKPASTALTYIPGKAPEDMAEEMPSQEVINDIKEKVTVYKDIEGLLYAAKPTIQRFKLDQIGNEVKINGISCYQISEEDYKIIEGKQDNDYSPFDLRVLELNIKLNEEVKEETTSKELGPGAEERITVYKDIQGLFYVAKPVIERFKLDKIGDEIKINGISCYQISEEDYKKIESKQNNDYSPFTLRVIELSVKLNEKDSPNKTENPTLPPQSLVQVNPEPTKTATPKEKVTEPIKEVTSRKYHVEEIINEITAGISIGPSDAKRYIASNVRVVDSFREELRKGNFAYNVIHFIPNLIKASYNFGRKLGGSIALTDSAKEAMNEVEDRLNKLTSDKLEVLLEEYKGYQMKTDMNNQVNRLIVERLQRYATSRAENINKEIKQDYANLFVILGQVKNAEDESNKEELMQQSADLVRKITDLRQQASNYLTGGVLGTQEEARKVAKRLPYIDYSFANKKDFNGELQAELAKYGKGLSEGLATNNNEAIVSNFVKLETSYHDHTERIDTLTGKKNVGDKDHDEELGKILDEYNAPQEEELEKSSTK